MLKCVDCRAKKLSASASVCVCVFFMYLFLLFTCTHKHTLRLFLGHRYSCHAFCRAGELFPMSTAPPVVSPARCKAVIKLRLPLPFANVFAIVVAVVVADAVAVAVKSVCCFMCLL